MPALPSSSGSGAPARPWTTRLQISLSLVSHTNAGKTTLARSLLGRDVGEVRDAPHVTEFAEVFTLIDDPVSGDALLLWDTPGFGDSIRLAKRLRLLGQPLGWFLSQVWDRFRDRPFWATQRAIENVRDEADAMLYLVNAAESPEAAAYVGPEMEILAWVDKPIVVLLNQLGAPRPAADEADDVRRWRAHLAPHANVRAVLPLDAFARCWVQEFGLWRAIEAALDPSLRPAMRRLGAAWAVRRWATFDAAADRIADALARLAADVEPIASPDGLRSRLRGVGAALGIGDAAQAPAAVAQRALGARLDDRLRTTTTALIALHGLDGRAEAEILARVATHYESRARIDEGRAALWGGALTGALAGLKADVLSGGLTLGGGLLAGGVLGAIGAAGAARGANRLRGTDRSWVRWNAEALDRVLEALVLRYLAVAHFGRGRGEWAVGESPPHWVPVVAEAIGAERTAFAAVWQRRSARPVAGGDGIELLPALRTDVRRVVLRTLQQLYPDVDALRADRSGAGPRENAAASVGGAG